jgi:hypothetical protein
MVRESRWLMATFAALALLAVSAGASHAQTVVCYQPAPVVAAPVVTSYYAAPAPVVTSYYAAPAPVVYAAPAPVVTSYYAAPVVTSYYAAPAVTAYRYGPFGRLRGVSSYYPAAPVYYSPAPTIVRYRGWGFYP